MLYTIITTTRRTCGVSRISVRNYIRARLVAPRISKRSLGLADALIPISNLIFKAGKSRFACFHTIAPDEGAITRVGLYRRVVYPITNPVCIAYRYALGAAGKWISVEQHEYREVVSICGGTKILLHTWIC